MGLYNEYIELSYERSTIARKERSLFLKYIKEKNEVTFDDDDVKIMVHDNYGNDRGTNYVTVSRVAFENGCVSIETDDGDVFFLEDIDDDAVEFILGRMMEENDEKWETR